MKNRFIKGRKNLVGSVVNYQKPLYSKQPEHSEKRSLSRQKHAMKNDEKYHSHISTAETVMNLIKLYHRTSFNIGHDTCSLILK